MERKKKIAAAVLIIGAAAAAVVLITRPRDEPGDLQTAASAPAPLPHPGPAGDAAVFSAYAGSESCRECHPMPYALWRGSHHALAERRIDLEQDRRAFDPPQTFRHGSQTSEARLTGGRPEVTTVGPGGERRAFAAERVFGVHPLRQFLIPFPGGRWQATEIAWDPERGDWFDVYGDEDRKPGDWGHWTGRGMNWNSMCAPCHNTRIRKNYDRGTDAYATTLAEMGVGCEACHGPLAAHAAWQEKHPRRAGDPTIPRFAKERVPEICGSCHSRRGDLTGEFSPGERFLDHYAPVIVDDTDIYLPDGQVRDEDFEYVSFLSSRMHLEGVRCLDCHDPHSGRTLASGNALCLRCHQGKIDPRPHSRHEPDTPGGRCIDCHMPLTTYMQRHPRRDHGFTIPDPLLTRELNIPNACNRCHTDRSTDWAIEAVEKRYGNRMERHTRDRARRIAAARTGRDAAVDGIIALAREEKSPLWRAAGVHLLRLWPENRAAQTVVLKSTSDPEPLVRAMAARALDPRVHENDPDVQGALRRLLEDPVRLVRIDAAWALRAGVDPSTRAGNDLWNMLLHNSDQPGGALQLGIYNLDRGMPQAALPYLEQAASWDPNSPAFRHSLAICLSRLGRIDRAAEELEAACRLSPRDALLHFHLALALNESGRLPESAAALEKAVKIDERFARAWYNLALARRDLGAPDRALEAFDRAEALEPGSAEIPFARADLLYRLGRLEDARAAARRALDIEPGHPGARGLLEIIETGGKND